MAFEEWAVLGLLSSKCWRTSRRMYGAGLGSVDADGYMINSDDSEAGDIFLRVTYGESGGGWFIPLSER